MAMKKQIPILDIFRMEAEGEQAIDIANSLSLDKTTIYRYQKLRKQKGLHWNILKDLTDYELDELFNGKSGPTITKATPDFPVLEGVFKDRNPKRGRRKFAKRELFELYQSINGKNSYGRSQFFSKYRDYCENRDPSMLLDHEPGELQIDFCGMKLRYRDESGSVRQAEVFCTCLALSKLTYARACASQKVEDWLDCHIAAVGFYGGVPPIWLIDNLKSGVQKPGRNPLINRSYRECARHYDAYIKAARVRRAQDKAVVENAVGIVTNHILTPLSDRIFNSLAELNQSISEKLEELNNRPFQDYPGNRWERFNQLEKAHLKPLPAESFQYGNWLSARKVPNTCHIKIDNHSYSVPHHLIGQKVEPRVGIRFVEIFYQGKCVALHGRSRIKGGSTRDVNHLTKGQREYLKQSYEDYLSWAERFGIAVKAVVEAQFKNADHHCPQALGRCARLKEVARHQDSEQFESSCLYALELGSPTPTRIRDILSSKAYSLPSLPLVQQIQLPLHENVRGGEYYTGRSV